MYTDTNTNPDCIAYEAKFHIYPLTTKLKIKILFLNQKKNQCFVVQWN